MNITDVLSGAIISSGPTSEQMEGVLKRRIARIRWAFNGEDGDCLAVNGLLDAVDLFEEKAVAHRKEFEENPGEETMRRIGSTSAINVIIQDVTGNTGKALIDLESLAAVRVMGQGRWFTDKDGPDYQPPSSENPQEN